MLITTLGAAACQVISSGYMAEINLPKQVMSSI